MNVKLLFGVLLGLAVVHSGCLDRKAKSPAMPDAAPPDASSGHSETGRSDSRLGDVPAKDAPISSIPPIDARVVPSSGAGSGGAFSGETGGVTGGMNTGTGGVAGNAGVGSGAGGDTSTMGTDTVSSSGTGGGGVGGTSETAGRGGTGGVVSSTTASTKGPSPAGSACMKDEDCADRHCIDGFCCATTCGDCNACSNELTGKDNGVCAPVLSGKDPHDQCADETATKPCGDDGSCDGKGACRKVGSGQKCGPASCKADGSAFTPESKCDDTGTCVVQTPQICTPYQCTATGCAKTCSKNTDCGTGSYCNTTTGTCANVKSNGSPATDPSECESDVIADGVCCDKACTGCSACTPALNGQAASTMGRCLPVVANKAAPHNACTASPPCGLDGTCDGNGSCHYPPLGTPCGTPSCSGSTLTTSACTSAHACAASANAPCPLSLKCESASGCKSSCADDTDCVVGHYCASGGACMPKKEDGDTCSVAAPNQCKNGNCVSGVCCNVACGECNSCATGTCTPIANGTGCSTGKICHGGACQAGCWIGNAYIAASTVNPNNSCQICNPSKSTTSWSNNDGAQVACGTCGGTASCTNGAPGACSKSPSTFYRDADGDHYGNSGISTTACTAPTDYVANAQDCDDSSSTIVPGYSICGGNDRYYCDGTPPLKTEPCADGCLNNQCRTDGNTVGKIGWVSCYAYGATTATRCQASVGCQSGVCTTAGGTSYMACDGPNDCNAGEKCCGYIDRGGVVVSRCSTSPCSDMGGYEACDPRVSTCSGKTCTLSEQGRSIYFCI